MDASFEYSVIVPVYNEKGNVGKLDREIKKVMTNLRKSYEIIYVNDGSTDGSFEELNSLKDIIIINLNRNYGQATALDAGFKLAKGKIIISMDGDGQNNPEDIPRLLKKMADENLDVVTGWRENRKDKKGVRILTLVGRFLRKRLIGDSVHDTGCTLRVYRQAAVKSLDLQGEMHRYILALLRWKGFRIGELAVDDRKRKNGESAYGYSKAIRGFVDLIYIWFIQKYSQRSLHMFGALGLFSFFMGFFSGGYTLYTRIFEGLPLNRNGWFFLFIFFILTGILFFIFGIIADLLIKIHLNNSPHEKRYYVREVIEK